MTVRGRAAAVAAYAGATFLAFPHPLGDRVVDLGLLFGWLSPALLLAAIAGLRPGRAAAVGFAAGVLAHAAVLHWIYVVTVTHGHAPPVVGVIAPVLLACYVALFSAAFSAAAAAVRVQGPLRPYLLAAVWVSADLLRSVVFTGFPWATLGYALHADQPLLGLVSFTGVYGLSFAGALAGACLFAAVQGARREVVAGLCGLVVLHGLGVLSWQVAPGPGADHVRVAVLQGNILQGQKWNAALALHIMDVYEDLTRSAVEQGAEVVVWPETAVPGSPDTDPVLLDRLQALARETGATLVVGAVGVEGYTPGADRGAVRFFDSAFMLDASGAQFDRYDKTHLVPFGEFLPFRALIGRFVSAVATGITSGDVSRGDAPRAVELPRAGGEPPLRVGVPICYELLFPDLMRRFAGDGARVLLAMTNDAWYGRTGAPHQFLVITALRAAESRTWVARAANTGVTALIDDRGRVHASTRIFERDLLVGDVPLAEPGGSGTFYVRHGDWFAGACGVVAIGALVLAARRRRADG